MIDKDSVTFFRIVPNVVEVDGNCEERSLGKERPLMLTVADLVETQQRCIRRTKCMHTLVGKGMILEYHIIRGRRGSGFPRSLAQDLSLLEPPCFLPWPA